ncbi:MULTISPECIES: carbohydrate ABC transporter permease [Clostridium]|uniref:Carbohydrate ABC transporter permease n=1 Tax=Clostridium frigoriphilum TaxID=443253 RepID=A0ABU7ULW8_9CLOT|nr:carbohydrate ABC transporter permease [Clostridium sp. DSM 17811]MBU3099770.1 carbohydrate ABC transporter permease [Clostridium sp. DSM 17811]
MAEIKKSKSVKGSGLVYVILTIVAIVCFFPFVWTIIASSHTNTQIFQSSKSFVIGTNSIKNYINLMAFSNIWRNLFNSIFIATVYTILVCIIDSMAAFAFSKYKFKGRDVLFFICVCSMFIPQQVTLVPLFMQLSAMNLISSPSAVILPALASIFGVFLMRQNLMAFPDELMESARIDGANDFRMFFQIVVPTMKPAFTSLAILSFVQQWGNYLWPLIVLNTKDSFTIPLVLALMRAGGNIVDYGAIMVGAVMALVPVLVLFLFFQKNFIQGMLSGSLKG